MAEKSEVGALDHSIFNYGLEIWDGGSCSLHDYYGLEIWGRGSCSLHDYYGLEIWESGS